MQQPASPPARSPVRKPTSLSPGPRCCWARYGSRSGPVGLGGRERTCDRTQNPTRSPGGSAPNKGAGSAALATAQALASLPNPAAMQSILTHNLLHLGQRGAACLASHLGSWTGPWSGDCIGVSCKPIAPAPLAHASAHRLQPWGVAVLAAMREPSSSPPPPCMHGRLPRCWTSRSLPRGRVGRVLHGRR